METNRIIVGEALAELKKLPDESIDCVMTSPPYWGLRDYGTATWEGGDEKCDHKVGRNTRGGLTDFQAGNQGGYGDEAIKTGQECPKCGAVRQDQQLGLEPDFRDFIENLCLIFDEVKRTLKPSGTCWVNMGSTYCSSPVVSKEYILREDLSKEEVENVKEWFATNLLGLREDNSAKGGEGALRKLLRTLVSQEAGKPDQGSRVSQEVLSSEQGKGTSPSGSLQSETQGRPSEKPGESMRLLRREAEGVSNPGSHQGRGQKGVSKSNGAKNDLPTGEEGWLSKGQVQSALLELQLGTGNLGLLSSLEIDKQDIPKALASYFKPKHQLKAKTDLQIPSRFALAMTDRGWILRNELIWHKANVMPSSVKDRFTVDFEKLFFFTKSPRYYFEQQLEPVSDVSLERVKSGWKSDRVNNSKDGPQGIAVEEMGSRFANPEGRNKRAVWQINPKPFSEAHFAVYPEKLCEVPIKAGCPEGGTVLDPFFGSGTTGLVAEKLGRKWIGIELSEEYAQIARRRTSQQGMY